MSTPSPEGPRKRPRPPPPGGSSPLGPPRSIAFSERSPWQRTVFATKVFIDSRLPLILTREDSLSKEEYLMELKELSDRFYNAHEILMAAVEELEPPVPEPQPIEEAPLVEEAAPFPPPPSTPTVPASYAQAAALPNASRPGQRRKPLTQLAKDTSPRKNQLAPTKTLNPVRLIAQLHDQSLPVRDLSTPTFYRSLAEAISKARNTNAPQLLGIQWNKKGNLVMSFPAGTSRTAIKSCYPAIRSALGSESHVNLCFDVPWGRVHLANVCAREGLDLAIASEEDLRETLQLNPAIQALNITLQARWLKKPESISGTHTSAVIAFEDPDGTVARGLLNSRIFAFGEPVTVRKWLTKPPNRLS